MLQYPPHMAAILPAITGDKLKAIIKDLTEKILLQYQIAEKHKIHPSTVTNIKKRFIVVVKESKKTVTRGESSNKFDIFKRKAGKIIAEGLDHLDAKKLKKCSAPQLVTAIAILVDKVKMLQDRMEEVTSTRFESRGEMIEYIQHGEEGAPSPQQAVPVPGIASPPDAQGISVVLHQQPEAGGGNPPALPAPPAEKDPAQTPSPQGAAEDQGEGKKQ